MQDINQLDVKAPPTFDNAIKSLFYQIAAKYGCADYLVPQNGSVQCVKSCANCVFEKLKEEYIERVQNITLQFVDNYLDDLKRDRLHPVEQAV